MPEAGPEALGTHFVSHTNWKRLNKSLHLSGYQFLYLSDEGLNWDCLLVSL